MMRRKRNMVRGLGRTALGLGLLAGCLAAGGCLPSEGTPPPAAVGDKLTAEYLVVGAQNPAALAAVADGRVFYTEKNTGRVRIINRGVLLDEAFAEVPVNFAGDHGLLGIAAHPNFAQNGRIYVFYTRSSTGLSTNVAADTLDHRVVYFEANGNLAAGGEIFVASLPAGPGTARVGGRVGFAADGKLLVALGDQENPDAAQDLNALSGKILRYNDDGSIPADNPIANSPYFARGVRDPRGLGFDTVGGAPFAIDRNENGNEEINRLLSNRNYGWSSVAGGAKTGAQLQFAADNPNYLDPLLDTFGERPALAGCAFNPSARYGFPAQHQLFYAEAAKNRIMRLNLTADRTGVAGRAEFAFEFPGQITDLVFTPAGTLYVACEDTIFRLAPQAP